MPEETCYPLNCCPLGLTVPPITISLPLLAEDPLNLDPQVIDGEPLLVEQGYVTFASCISGSSVITVPAYLGTPIVPAQTVSVFGIRKQAASVFGSPTLSLSNVVGLSLGLQFVGAPFTFGSNIQNIVGNNLTISTNAYATRASLIVTFLSNYNTQPQTILPLGSTVSSVSTTSITISNPATTTVSDLVVIFSPSNLDVNAVDGSTLNT